MIRLHTWRTPNGRKVWLAPMPALDSPRLAERPRVRAWLDRIAARPAVQRGMAVPAA